MDEIHAHIVCLCTKPKEKVSGGVGERQLIGLTQEGVERVLSTKSGAWLLLLEVDGGNQLADGRHRGAIGTR